MATSVVRLIGAWPSPFTMGACVSLNAKSIDYEFLQEQLGTKSEIFLKCNPVYKKTPVSAYIDNKIPQSPVKCWSQNGEKLSW
ncbi:Glutathione S-transferase, partial [Sarracenia purpurea var. burkii]